MENLQGGIVEVDIPYRYMSFFCDDDELLDRLAREYRSGELLTGQMKEACIQTLQPMVAQHQARRADVTDELVELFMTPRPMMF